MSSTSIRSKVKAGLAKAVIATGSSSADTVYKVIYTNTGGDTPIDLPSFAESATELPNAIFKSYKTAEFNDNIRKGDKILVSDDTVSISEGDTIRQGSTDYAVISTDTKAPTSDVLVYISQVREL
ncbi:MAG: hypothetical protein GY820_38380 [Gammaproteobacteria bacterium]|nr:hypothetical protein [Gammaproteobacteria bacterium]